MNSFNGKSLSWSLRESCIELELHHTPANEIGTAMLGELEQFAANLDVTLRARQRAHHLQL